MTATIAVLQSTTRWRHHHLLSPVCLRSEDQLIDLTKLAMPDTQDSNEEKLQRAMYPSPGGSDEFVQLFLHQRRVKRDELKDWKGKLTGLRSRGEKITLKLVPLDQVRTLYRRTQRRFVRRGTRSPHFGDFSVPMISASGMIDQAAGRMLAMLP